MFQEKILIALMAVTTEVTRVVTATIATTEVGMAGATIIVDATI
jgi:hypothetical protein